MALPNRPNQGGHYSGRWPPPGTNAPEDGNTGDRSRPIIQPFPLEALPAGSRRVRRTATTSGSTTFHCGENNEPLCRPCELCVPAPSGLRSGCSPEWWEVDINGGLPVTGTPGCELDCATAAADTYILCTSVGCFYDNVIADWDAGEERWRARSPFGGFLECGQIQSIGFGIIDDPIDPINDVLLAVTLYYVRAFNDPTTYQAFYALTEPKATFNCDQPKTLPFGSGFDGPSPCNPVPTSVTVTPGTGIKCCACPIDCSACTQSQPILAQVLINNGAGNCQWCSQALRLQQIPAGSCQWGGTCSSGGRTIQVSISCVQAGAAIGGPLGEDVPEESAHWRIHVLCVGTTDPVRRSEYQCLVPVDHGCLLPGADSILSFVCQNWKLKHLGCAIHGFAALSGQGSTPAAPLTDEVTLHLYSSDQTGVDNEVDNLICPAPPQAWIGQGNWSDPNNWTPTGVPAPIDSVAIDNTAWVPYFNQDSSDNEVTAFVDVNSTVDNIELTGSSGTMILQVLSGIVLTVTGALTLNPGSILRGPGTVVGTVVNNGGRIEP